MDKLVSIEFNKSVNDFYSARAELTENIQKVFEDIFKVNPVIPMVDGIFDIPKMDFKNENTWKATLSGPSEKGFFCVALDAYILYMQAEYGKDGQVGKVTMILAGKPSVVIYERFESTSFGYMHENLNMLIAVTQALIKYADIMQKKIAQENNM